jgi:hypothetical protein
VKRYGYRGDLNDKHMNMIHDDIGLDLSKLSGNTEENFVYKNDEVFDNSTGKWKTRKLMLLGLLYTWHASFAKRVRLFQLILV